MSPRTLPTGRTEIVRVDGSPWFLGFCRWSEERWNWDATRSAYAIVTPLRGGRWKWRGFGAPYRETVL